MSKTILGIGGWAAIVAVAHIGSYVFDYHHTYKSLWVILQLCSWPFLLFGHYHFAKHRGFSGAVGCGLFFVAFCISIMLMFLFGVRGGGTHIIFAILVFNFFAAAFPVAVLMALPRRDLRHLRRKKRRER